MVTRSNEAPVLDTVKLPAGKFQAGIRPLLDGDRNALKIESPVELRLPFEEGEGKQVLENKNVD